MATYYGQGPDGQMGHIRLKETMEQWHVRCAEQGERIRQLREDTMRPYEVKATRKDVRELKAWREAAGHRFDEMTEELHTLSTAVALLILELHPEAAGSDFPDEELPEPDGGWCPGCPDCRRE